MSKLKNLVINLLNIFSWVMEFYIIYEAAWLIYELGRLLISSKARNQFFNSEAMRLDAHTLTMVSLNAVNELLLAIAICILLYYGRKLIKNIKHQFFFTTENLQLVRKTFIYLIVYTVLQITSTYFLNSSFETQLSHYFSTSSNLPALIFLGIFFLFYTIFKNGLELQEDTNKII